MQKHMLMIGGSTEVLPKAKALGLRVTAIFDTATLKKKRPLIDLFDRVISLPASADTAEWIELARAVHRNDPIDCIGAFNEPTQARAVDIASALGLRYHGAEVIRLTRQKDAMRRALREAGIDATSAEVVEGADAVARFGAMHGYPIVLKPVDGRASIGVSVVRSPSEIAAAIARFQRCAPGFRMLAEQFLSGDEFSVEAFSEAGAHRIVCVTQKYKDAETCVETGHCLPAPIDERTRGEIERFVSSTLAAIGLRDGGSHTEVIVSADGPHIVETHARLAGDSIVELIALASGCDLDELWLRQCTGQSVIDGCPPRFERHASIMFATPRAVGSLERVIGLEEASALPGVVRVELLRQPGARVEGAEDSFGRCACAIAVGDSAEQAVERARAAASRLRFVVTCSG